VKLNHFTPFLILFFFCSIIFLLPFYRLVPCYCNFKTIWIEVQVSNLRMKHIGLLKSLPHALLEGLKFKAPPTLVENQV